jgi:hypothetical protein
MLCCLYFVGLVPSCVVHWSLLEASATVVCTGSSAVITLPSIQLSVAMLNMRQLYAGTHGCESVVQLCEVAAQLVCSTYIKPGCHSLPSGPGCCARLPCAAARRGPQKAPNDTHMSAAVIVQLRYAFYCCPVIHCCTSYLLQALCSQLAHHRVAVGQTPPRRVSADGEIAIIQQISHFCCSRAHTFARATCLHVRHPAGCLLTRRQPSSSTSPL